MEGRKRTSLLHKIDTLETPFVDSLKKLGIDFNEEEPIFKGKKRGNIVKILKRFNKKIDKNHKKIEERLELIEERLIKKMEEVVQGVTNHICTLQDMILELNEDSESDSDTDSENEN